MKVEGNPGLGRYVLASIADLGEVQGYRFVQGLGFHLGSFSSRMECGTVNKIHASLYQLFGGHERVHLSFPRTVSAFV
jgi:hypothetical protein